MYPWVSELAFLYYGWSRIILEKLTVTKLAKKFPTSYVTRRLITAFTTEHHWSLPEWIQFTPFQPTSLRSILLLSSYVAKSPLGAMFLVPFFWQKLPFVNTTRPDLLVYKADMLPHKRASQRGWRNLKRDHVIMVEPNPYLFPDYAFQTSGFIDQNTGVMKLNALTLVYAAIGHEWQSRMCRWCSLSLVSTACPVCLM
jgi:hypothetical protein